MREMLQPMNSFVTTEGLSKVVAPENCGIKWAELLLAVNGLTLRMLKLVSSDQHE